MLTLKTPKPFLFFNTRQEINLLLQKFGSFSLLNVPFFPLNRLLQSTPKRLIFFLNHTIRVEFFKPLNDSVPLKPYLITAKSAILCKCGLNNTRIMWSFVVILKSDVPLIRQCLKPSPERVDSKNRVCSGATHYLTRYIF